jgi:hypothetical protein
MRFVFKGLIRERDVPFGLQTMFENKIFSRIRKHCQDKNHTSGEGEGGGGKKKRSAYMQIFNCKTSREENATLQN